MSKARACHFLLLFLLLSSCKKSVQSPSTESAPAASPTKAEEKEVNKFEKSVNLVESEKLSFKIEYEQFKAALKVYINSEPYKKASTEEELAFNDLIRAADLLDEKEVRKLIGEKKFSLMYNRAQANPDRYQSVVDKLFAQQEDSQGLNLAQRDLSESKKDSLRVGTGSLLAYMGSLGVIGAAYGIYKNPVLEGQSRLGANSGKLAFGGLALYALTVGAMMVSEEGNPSQSTIQAAQVLIGSGAGIAGILALAVPTLIYKSGHPQSGIEELNRQISDNLANRHAVSDLRSKRNFSVGFAGAGFLIFGGIAVGLGVWTHDLALAATLSEKETVLAKVGRAFVAFKKLESQWAD